LQEHLLADPKDDEKYIAAMKKNLAIHDTANTNATFQMLANSFERIANTEKDKWLPYYYASLVYVLASFTDTLNEKKDGYLDKSDYFINTADSLQQDESEIYTMKGMIAQARMSIDPMNRWQKYGSASTQNFQIAIELDTLNPRPEYLIGVSLFYTPEQFGGGPQAAKPYFEKSLKKYDEFKPDNELMPNWGREMVVHMMKQIEG
jgi:hypothetical protein